MTTRPESIAGRLALMQKTARDAASFEAAVAPLYGSLVRRLVLVTGDVRDAEDLAQDAYLRAFRAWDRFDGADVRAWLYTIALRWPSTIAGADAAGSA